MVHRTRRIRGANPSGAGFDGRSGQVDGLGQAPATVAKQCLPLIQLGRFHSAATLAEVLTGDRTNAMVLASVRGALDALQIMPGRMGERKGVAVRNVSGEIDFVSPDKLEPNLEALRTLRDYGICLGMIYPGIGTVPGRMVTAAAWRKLEILGTV